MKCKTGMALPGAPGCEHFDVWMPDILSASGKVGRRCAARPGRVSTEVKGQCLRLPELDQLTWAATSPDLKARPRFAKITAGNRPRNAREARARTAGTVGDGSAPGPGSVHQPRARFHLFFGILSAHRHARCVRKVLLNPALPAPVLRANAPIRLRPCAGRIWKRNH